MKYQYIPCLLIGALMLLGCSHKAVSCIPNSKLDSLKSFDHKQASTDADHAFANGDRRLLGIYSAALEVPGLNGNPDSYAYGIKPLDGTGDTICSDEEKHLNEVARKYAQQYNEEVLSLTKSAK